MRNLIEGPAPGPNAGNPPAVVPMPGDYPWNAQMYNPDGTPRMKPVLDTQTFLKAAMELANYSRPKLKAVEVTNKTPELTDEQIDRRLEALITRVGKTR